MRDLINAERVRDIKRQVDQRVHERRSLEEDIELHRRTKEYGRWPPQLPQSPFFRERQVFRRVMGSRRNAIRRGERGYRVCMIQAALSVGPNAAKLVADGIFGWKTEEAVSRFQRLKKLEATGMMDKDTLRVLDEHVRRLPGFGEI